jgi:hypothetical protein
MMLHKDCYFILCIVDITQEMWDNAHQTNELNAEGEVTYLKSIDGMCTILKYTSENVPTSLENETCYTHEEIKQILLGPDWNPDYVGMK